MNGLTVCGNLLPAVGMAMLLKLLWNNKICVYFFLGFVLVAYLKLPLIALAALGVIAALLVAQRDLELNQLLRVKAAAAPAAVPAQGILDEEEEDFSMSKITDVSREEKKMLRSVFLRSFTLYTSVTPANREHPVSATL